MYHLSGVRFVCVSSCLSRADRSYGVRWGFDRRERAATLAVLRLAIVMLRRARAVQALRERVG